MKAQPGAGAPDPDHTADRGATSTRLISASDRRRAFVAGCVGNLVEWYDFAL